MLIAVQSFQCPERPESKHGCRPLYQLAIGMQMHVLCARRIFYTPMISMVLQVRHPHPPSHHPSFGHLLLHRLLLPVFVLTQYRPLGAIALRTVQLAQRLIAVTGQATYLDSGL